MQIIETEIKQHDLVKVKPPHIFGGHEARVAKLNGNGTALIVNEKGFVLNLPLSSLVKVDVDGKAANAKAGKSKRNKNGHRGSA